MENVNYLETRELAVRALDRLVVGELFWFIHDGRVQRHQSSSRELVEVVRAPYFYRHPTIPDIYGIRFDYKRYDSSWVSHFGPERVWEGYPTDRGVLEYGYEYGKPGRFNDVNWTLSVTELAKLGLTLVG